MSYEKVEPFCCTCGKEQDVDEIRVNENATTMCDDCTEELANFCCKCGKDMRKNFPKTTLCLCSHCHFKLRLETTSESIKNF